VSLGEKMKNNSTRTKTLWYVLAILIVLLDQLSKWLITHHFQVYETLSVFRGFDLTLRYNTGAAFSFLDNAGGWQRGFFVGLASAVSIILLIWIKKLDAAKKIEGIGLALILGGAIGNLIDRVLYGKVIDFILLYYKHWEYPAFNIADSSICIGAVLLGFSLLLPKKVL
jgi:signal peptidase II